MFTFSSLSLGLCSVFFVSVVLTDTYLVSGLALTNMSGSLYEVSLTLEETDSLAEQKTQKIQLVSHR